MRKATKKKIALFLVFCLIATGFSPLQAKAAEAGVTIASTDVKSNAINRLAGAAKEKGTKLPTAEEYFQPDDMVRVLVILEEPSLSENGFQVFGMETAASDSINAMEQTLIQKQNEVLDSICDTVRKNTRSNGVEVNYNFTKAVNGMSITVPFGSLEEIRRVGGVKEAFVVPVYSVPEDQKSLSNMIYQEYAWESGYKGEGMKIAIIDTGIDTDHNSFAAAPPLTSDSLSEGSLAVFLRTKQLHAQELMPELSAADLYLSAKIPYAFNYVDENLTVDHSSDEQGDHGTHVAGIAAANQVEGEIVAGIAPNAQLLVMKVFGAAGGAYADDILAAIEDAAVLGADVVNLSLGSPSGFSSENAAIDAIYARVFELGTFASISAGNEYTAGLLNQYGYHMSLASNPDNGVVGSPSTYSEATSVASIESDIVMDFYIESEGERYTYMDTSSNYPELKILGFLDTLGGETYEVALVDPEVHGYGATKEEFIAAGVEGKIALVQRGGGVNFTDKQLHAQEAGAVACIIYNNDIGTLGINFTGGTATLPCVSITEEAGTAIAENCWAVSGSSEIVELYVSDSEGAVQSETGWEMSDFSSWGVTPDLALRPDITAPGGNIYSTLDGGIYGNMSGTSMAAPKLAGAAALLLQQLKVKYSILSKSARKTLADQILMSTAEPVVDSTARWYYSPRKQGSGLVNIESALTTNAYLTVPGSEKPKAELGDDEAKTGVYEYTFEVNNLSGEELYYLLDTSVQTERPMYDGENIFMQGLPFTLNGDATVTYSSANKVELGKMVSSVESADAEDAEPAVVTEFVWSEEGDRLKGYLDGSENFVIKVPAYETATVKVQIQLGEDVKKFLDMYYENGIYVEGYTFLYALQEGGVDLSLPYLAFYGDWTQAPIFDTAIAWDEEAVPSQYWHAIFLDGGIFGAAFPGENLFTGELDLERAAVSPNGDGLWDGMDDMYLSLLRNAKKINIIFSNEETGEVYAVLDIDYARKSSYRAAYGQIVPLLYSWYYYPYDFTYQTEDGEWEMIPENTKVKVTVEAYGDFDKFGNTAPEVLDFGVSFLIDITAPELVDTAPVKSEDGNALNISIRDNGYIQLALLAGMEEDAEEILLPLDGQVPGEALTISIPAEYAMEPMDLLMMDYAGNISEYTIQYVEPTPTPTPTITYPSYPGYSTPTPIPTEAPSPTPTEAPTSEPTATPTPEAPIGEPVPVVETVEKDELVWTEVTISEEDAAAIVEKQKELGEEEKLEVSIVIPETVADVSEEVKDVVIVVGVPEELTEAGIEPIIILPEKLIENAKENEVNITVEVLDADANAQVIWKFNAEQLAASEEEITDVNLLVAVEKAEDAGLAEEAASVVPEGTEVIDFTHEGILPATAEITVNTGFKGNTTVYLYYYNEEKGCLDVVPANEYTVKEDGTIVFHIVHCSKYILSSEKIETARSLEDQIEALTDKQVLYVGGTVGYTVDVKPVLPSTLKESADLGEAADPARMAVKLSYASSNPSVAAVDENGTVTAVKRGSATITITAELANGAVKTFEVPVSVSKASAKLVMADQAYAVGDAISVSVELKGYDPSEIRWATSRRSIAVVRKYKGKTKAVVKAMSAGTDWIVIYAGDKKILRAKIVIAEAKPEGEVQ